MKRVSLVDLTQPGAVVGRHSAWLPALGLKMPFQFGGKVTKYRHDEAGYDPADSISHELAILRALAAEGMAPPIGDVVRVETVVSEHRGAWHADPTGAWAYEMLDATKLPPGRFSLARMRQMPISGSDGAWSDISVPGRDNVVNGYLVDVRRSAFDMLRWDGILEPPPLPGENLEALRTRVHRECQFPAGARAEAYQDFFLRGKWECGQRRVPARAVELGFQPQPGESVLDIGCQSGGFLQLAAIFGADRVAGVDVDPNYVDCARALARANGQNICFRRMDVVAERAAFLEWVRAYYPNGVDHLLCLSLEKHIGESFLFDLIDAVGARRTYVETNAVKSRADLKMWPLVQKRHGVHVGFTDDRNLRALYQIGAAR